MQTTKLAGLNMSWICSDCSECALTLCPYLKTFLWIYCISDWGPIQGPKGCRVERERQSIGLKKETLMAESIVWYSLKRFSSVQLHWKWMITEIFSRWRKKTFTISSQVNNTLEEVDISLPKSTITRHLQEHSVNTDILQSCNERGFKLCHVCSSQKLSHHTHSPGQTVFAVSRIVQFVVDYCTHSKRPSISTQECHFATIEDPHGPLHIVQRPL